MSDDWRIEITAEDYFSHKQKKLEVADRRPVIRKSSDLAGMGPGFNATCVAITDFNDLIATYDGFYSATMALNGPFPNPPGPNEGKDPGSYVGTVVSDDTIGGYQRFTRIPNMFLNDFGKTYRREFSRAEADPDYIDWGPWYVEGSIDEPIGTVKMFYGDPPITGWLPMTGFTFSAVQYPALAALLGGTVTPDMRNRFPRGEDSFNVGATGGSQFLVPHAHTFTDGPHDHTIDAPTGSTTVQSGTGASVASASHAHGGDTGDTAVSATTDDSAADTHTQLPPYLVVQFWIKATHLY